MYDEEKTLEKIISSSIGIGVIQTLKELGLMDETVTEIQAHKMYSKKLVNQWAHKRWIVGYPNGNKTRAKFYYKRSELETASRMLDTVNIIPASKINQIMQTQFKSQSNEKSKNFKAVPAKF